MKKVKFLSILIIVLSVVAIGIISGKQMFKFLEASSSTGPAPGAPGSQNPDMQGTSAEIRTQILYSADKATEKPTPLLETKLREAPVPLSTSGSVVSAEKEEAENPKTSAEPTFDPKGEKWVAFSIGAGINVRSGPGITEKKLWKVSKGTKGTVLERRDGWTRIKWDFNRKEGWVRDDLLLQGPAILVTGLLENKGGIENVSGAAVKKANQKLAKSALKISSAIAKPAPVAETVKGFVEGGDLPKQAVISAEPMANIRGTPGVKQARIGRLPKGVVVEIKSVKKLDRYLWFEITYNQGKKTGWTREDNLKF